MAGVLAGHEAAARRRADGAAGVGLGEAHALGRQAVEVGRLDALLAVAAEVAVAEVVGQDEDDVGLGAGACTGAAAAPETARNSRRFMLLG